MPMQIYRVGSHLAAKRPGEYFTGDVRIDTQFGLDEPASSSGALVTFEPNTRTAWYCHPLGQYLAAAEPD